MLHPKGADEPTAQQDGQQSWLVAVDSVGARCTPQKGKNQLAEKLKASAKNSSSGSWQRLTRSALALSIMAGEPQA